MVQKNCRIFLPRWRSRLALLVFSLWILVLPQLAETRQSTDQTSSQEASSNESELDSHKHYINKDGKTINSPAKSKSGSILPELPLNAVMALTALAATVLAHALAMEE